MSGDLTAMDLGGNVAALYLLLVPLCYSNKADKGDKEGTGEVERSSCGGSGGE